MCGAQVVPAASASWRTCHDETKINQVVLLKEKRAEYRQGILQLLTAKLGSEFGRGFGKRSLLRMVRFSEVFPVPKIVSALRRQFVSPPYC